MNAVLAYCKALALYAASNGTPAMDEKHLRAAIIQQDK
jgi:hypothetical protein